MRKYLAVYDEINKGRGIYLDLLKHSKINFRIEACALLARLQTEASQILEILKEHYEQETAIEVRVALIENMINIPELLYSPEHRDYRDFVTDILVNGKDSADRLAAAKLILELRRYLLNDTDELEQQLSKVLFEAFIAETARHKKYDIARHISELKYRTIDSHLKTLSLQAEDAHLLVRALLCSYYINEHSKINHWYHRPRSPKETPQTHPYKNQIGKYYYLNTNIDRKPDPLIFKMILSCEAFWELPTNLLSVFHDLPNDRETLRKLVNKQT